MRLSKKILSQLNGMVDSIPTDATFELPEKVLQFGTGVLLRGLPDYFIDKANKQGLFNGRVVIVKSTDNGDTGAFEEQDGLYTQCIRGTSNQQTIEEYIINASVSRTLSARSQWSEVLKCAANPELEIIISNTTEVGIVLVEEDKIKTDPPASFPAKLLAFLYERYKVFHGDISKGMVIVPTELITDNGSKLQSIAIELAHRNKFDYAFIDWIENANCFCNSLVDRIVPGKLPFTEQKVVETKLGYKDDLMIMSEVYRLWAIESSDPKVKNALSFAAIDEKIIISADITRYRELKLRLLNGTHTFTCGVAWLAGFETVKDAMGNKIMGRYVYDLMINEIAPCIINKQLFTTEAYEFANAVLDRFRNPFLEHKWINISLQYTHKMKMRNVPLLLKYYQEGMNAKGYMSLGFAAYILFMKCELGESGKYYGEVNGKVYELQDNQAAYFNKVWKSNSVEEVVQKVLSNESLWGTDLTALPGFAVTVEVYLDYIIQRGMLETLKMFETNKKLLERREA
jgi:tagaturonate reductase